MSTCAILYHALSPLHPGVGQAADLVDLPIARTKVGIPLLPGSSIKGVIREERRPNMTADEWAAVFGPDHKNASEHAGAIGFADARLLALPVRSFRGTFAFVTSPLLLRLAARDLALCGIAPPALPALSGSARACVSTRKSALVLEGSLYLESLDLTSQPSSELDDWSDLLGPLAWPDPPDFFARHIAMVDDDVMGFLWSTATQLDTRIRIDRDTGTVADGALWIEESLPPETLMLGLADAWPSRRAGVAMTSQQVLDVVLPRSTEHLQFGGKGTVGRGRCAVTVVPAEGGADHADDA